MRGGDTLTFQAVGPRIADDLLLEFDRALVTRTAHDATKDRVAAWAFAELRRKHAADARCVDTVERIAAVYWHHDREEDRVWACLKNGLAEFRAGLLELVARARYAAARSFALVIPVKGRGARDLRNAKTATVGAVAV